PHIAETKTAKAHFWFHNIGLPAMMIGLAFVVSGNEAFIPLTAIGGTLVTLAVLVFAWNVVKT
ncbi:cytochrome c oxidase, partial [Anoxybacillus sp. KU2-6(11)]